MEQPDPIQIKARQLAGVQIGDLILTLCETSARVEHLTALVAQLTAERDALKKAGTSEA